MSESFSPVLNQSNMTLRGKISLSVFLVCKGLSLPTELFESNADRVFWGLGFGGIFFYVTGFAAKPVLKCFCVKWCDSWCCGYRQRKKSEEKRGKGEEAMGEWKNGG